MEVAGSYLGRGVGEPHPVGPYSGMGTIRPKGCSLHAHAFASAASETASACKMHTALATSWAGRRHRSTALGSRVRG